MKKNLLKKLFATIVFVCVIFNSLIHAPNFNNARFSSYSNDGYKDYKEK